MIVDPTWFCRVCGLKQSEPQYGETGDCPTHNFCASCGVQFGYGDFTVEACKNTRREWIDEKKQVWDAPELQPDNWSWEKQRENIPAAFRD